ncbi:MAG TPA: hypothetical protein VG820_09670 [Fimbriimonadaceae bacterium]|nr:hypothetical protein [Fimbriimonadaceae bacterium]
MALKEANPIVEEVEHAGLHYVSDSLPGILRRRAGRGFTYIHHRLGTIRDRRELDRIRRLAIPPAYERVWICADWLGHLQATGIDARGRKQYRYHPLFREVRDADKYHRMGAFGRALPAIREQADADLMRRGLPKEKVIASIVYLLERSLVRVGNEAYAKENRSFGLTTMRNRHVRVSGERIEFDFMGKSRVRHRIEIHDRRLARIVRRLQELPGQELFQYVDEEGQTRSVSSHDVNAYLRDVSGERFTAKDFRTWWGSLLALGELQTYQGPASPGAAKRAYSEVVKSVARQLGNTPQLCRKCYVHPAVFAAFSAGALDLPGEGPESLEEAEAQLLRLIERSERESA